MSYQHAEVDLFHRDDKFTGTIKVTFNTSDELDRAIENPIKILDQRYRVEKYSYRPRVIKCNYCQKFGHISRICRSKVEEKPATCGKCSGSGHETSECEVTAANYKCYHCSGKHEAGNKKCEIMKQKMEDLLSRGNYG